MTVPIKATRIEILDILRALALFGILFAHTEAYFGTHIPPRNH